MYLHFRPGFLHLPWLKRRHSSSNFWLGLYGGTARCGGPGISPIPDGVGFADSMPMYGHLAGSTGTLDGLGPFREGLLVEESGVGGRPVEVFPSQSSSTELSIVSHPLALLVVSFCANYNCL